MIVLVTKSFKTKQINKLNKVATDVRSHLGNQKYFIFKIM